MQWFICHIVLDICRCLFQINGHILPIIKCIYIYMGLSYAEPWNKRPGYWYWTHHENSAFPVHCQFIVNQCDKKIINIPLNNILFTTLCYFICHLKITPSYKPFLICWAWCTAHQMGFMDNLLETLIIKDTASPVCTMKACRGSRCIAPLILNLGSRWEWVVNSTFPWYPLNRTGVLWQFPNCAQYT